MPRLSRPLVIAFALIAGIAVAVLGRAPARAQEVERFNREIPATQEGWIDTGVELAEGETAAIAAFGRASWDGGQNGSGPEGAQIEWCAPISVVHPVGALLARVDGEAVVLGDGATLSGPGRVRLAYNDCPGQYFDNSGTFSVSLTVNRVAPPVPVQTSAQQATPASQSADADRAENGGSGGFPLARLLFFLFLVGGAVAAFIFGRRMFAGRRPRFDPSARLESSAWLAPVRLRDLQGEQMPKRWLTVGGPDADIDFGVPGVWARLVPLEDGSTRIERAGDEKIYIEGMPLILGQRLNSGQRIKVGVREFVFLEERQPQRPVRRESHAALDKPDPRVAA